VVDARTASTTGVDAFNALIAHREGRFTVQSAVAPAEPEMNDPLESLLLEAARLIDEAGRS